MNKRIEKILEAGHEITICKRDDGWFYVESRPQEVGSIEGAGPTLKVAWEGFFKMWDKEWLTYERSKPCDCESCNSMLLPHE